MKEKKFMGKRGKDSKERHSSQLTEFFKMA